MDDAEASVRVIDLADAAATEALGKRLADVVSAPGVIFLSGDLGAGKTTLTRALLAALGHKGAVPSPTYTLLESYPLPKMHCIHCDFYRIRDADEIEFLGLHDLMGADSLVLIEWPEHGAEQVLAADLRIRLGYHGAGRCASLIPISAAARTWVNALS